MFGRIGTISVLCLIAASSMAAHQAGPTAAPAPQQQKGPGPIEKLGPNLFRIGQIRVDTANREISLPGRVNSGVQVLEFIANTTAGFKAYETALTLDTDAVTFNAALILIGLDKAHAKVPEAKFGRVPPEGDPVEIWIECPGRQCERMRAERLMFDRRTNAPVLRGSWVYTGSRFVPDGRYLAELDGVLIGLYTDPAPIIEYVPDAAIGDYGTVMLNPNIGLAPETPITLTVKAIPQAAKH